MALDIKAILQAQRAQVVDAQLTGDMAVHLVLELRDTLVDVGVPTAHIAQRSQTGTASDTMRVELVPLGDVAPAAVAASDTPIGEEQFTVPGLMTVPRATSAMVPIVRAETRGEVVYLYDAISARGNARYAFRAVHLVNPTESTLEGGPISVYGADHFIGEGMTDQIPPRGTSVVPFALDRQVVVEAHATDARQLRRIIAAERGIVRAEMQDQRTTSFMALLKELDLLDPRETNFTPRNPDGSAGQPQKIADYWAVSEEKLGKLSAEKLAELRDNGALGQIYAHMSSLMGWDRLIALAMERGARMQAAANA